MSQTCRPRPSTHPVYEASRSGRTPDQDTDVYIIIIIISIFIKSLVGASALQRSNWHSAPMVNVGAKQAPIEICLHYAMFSIETLARVVRADVL